MTQNTNIKISAIRSSFLDFISDPFYYQELETVRYINDGLIIISDLKAFYLATLGGAISLSLEDKVGNFEVGKEADLVVIDTRVTPLLKLRNHGNNPDSLIDIVDELFTLMILGDEQVVKATYVAGNLVDKI